MAFCFGIRFALYAIPTPPPTPRIWVSSVNSYCAIILEYSVVRDVNIISVKLRCLHLTFISVILVRGVGGGGGGGGGSCPGWFILPPTQVWVRQCNQSIFIAS